ncbi:MAG: outer membrane protein assembly factor BamE [Gaiellaceae bacterium]
MQRLKPTTRSGWPTVAGVLAVALALSAGCGSAGAGSAACRQLRFDVAAWRNGSSTTSSDGLTTRQREADQVLKCRTLVGRTRRQVRRMLGPPEADSTRQFWTYLTGDERGAIKVDSEYLEVVFDSHGRVRSAHLYNG